MQHSLKSSKGDPMYTLSTTGTTASGKPNDPIITGLQNAMKMENTSLDKLNMLLNEVTDSKMRDKLQHHVEETNEQIQRIRGRLQALGITVTNEKAQAPPIEFAQTPPNQTAKIMDDVKNGYAYENFEVAHYEFLKKQSDEMNDDDTKKVAEHNQKEEKDFVKEIEDLVPDMVKHKMG
jgi:ferritin-like metal-binding protein YciE